MKAYRQIVEAELKKHFETDADASARSGRVKPVSETDHGLPGLAGIDAESERQPFRARRIFHVHGGTARVRDSAGIIGMDPKVVTERFSEFAREASPDGETDPVSRDCSKTISPVTVRSPWIASTNRPFTVSRCRRCWMACSRTEEEVNDLLEVIRMFSPHEEASSGRQDIRTRGMSY